MDGTEELATHAISVAAMVAWTLGGAAGGIVVFLITLGILKLLARRSLMLSALESRTRMALFTVLTVAGATVGYTLADVTNPTIFYSIALHALTLLLIGCIGWFFYAACGIIYDLTQARIERDSRDSQRLQTQSQVLQRVLQSAVVIATLISMALTFEAARAPLASLLGAAGLLSVVTGLAAQSTLGNMFAGIQLAFTDAIRVGDTVTVTVGGTKESGTIEELTLTYVVLSIWNKRRVLLPSNYFTSEPFENWTRTGTDQLGEVTLMFDYPVPVPQLRLQIQKILAESMLWDRRSWNVQVTDSDDKTVTVRIVPSATTPGDRWDLECEVREKVFAWICEEIPWALPRARMVPEEIHVVGRDISDEKVAELAEDLRANSPDMSPPPEVADDALLPKNDPFNAARKRKIRREQKKARRRALIGAAQPQEPEQVEGTHLFSGSPEAEQRAELYSGPGEEVFEERKAAAAQQAQDARGEG